ncbi:MAG: Uma2 family endonuclease [Nitrospirae bacterium]|nr:Uma2 family endonuclease [Nitrospirota bacterium]
MTATVEKKRFTYEDYLKTPDDRRYELIEGELIMTPSPVPNHQRISRKIALILEKFVSENSLGEIFYAPLDVHLDDETVFEPDILFISKERAHIIGEKNIQGAPDLVIEILSETTAYNDVIKKKKIYAKFGVKEYWIADPMEKTVEIYSLKDGVFILEKSFSESHILESSLLAGLNIKLPYVFTF